MQSGKIVFAKFACATLLLSAGPALAQTQASGAPAPSEKNKDPSRIICEKIQETGSRLDVRKVCMTAQQWVEQHRRDREAIEEAQRTRTEPSGH